MLTISKRWQLLLASAALAALLAGCGAAEGSGGAAARGAESDPVPSASSNEPDWTEPAEDEAEERQMELVVYAADSDLHGLIGRSAVVDYGDESELAAAALEELQRPFGDEGISLWQGIDIVSEELENGVLTLDLHIPGEARLGAPGEQLLIDSLRETMFQLPFVDAIELLVDGERPESLMGHVALEHPIVK